MNAPEHFVVDTSYFLEGAQLPVGENYITVEEVLDELRRHAGSSTIMAVEQMQALGRLTIRRPSDPTMDRVKSRLDEQGLGDRLSPTDRLVVALVLQEGGCLLTLDRAMASAARTLGLEVRGLGDVSAVGFRPRCTGCGRWLEGREVIRDVRQGKDRVIGSCPICGSPVRVKRYGSEG